MAHSSDTPHACGPRPEVLEAISRLQSLAEVFLRRREQLAAAVGLSDSQWSVIEGISSEHFMPTLFARRRESSAAGVSRTLRQLTDKGLISSSVSREDGRQRDYALTAKGEALMDELRRHREQAISEIWTSFEPDELRQFNTFSQELITRLEAYSLRPHTENKPQPSEEGTPHHGEEPVRKSF